MAARLAARLALVLHQVGSAGDVPASMAKILVLPGAVVKARAATVEARSATQSALVLQRVVMV